ncbi:uncharacterized protein LOC141537409 isoform X2 [Cotesia typhae]|uniref:uncharacterized protein LOC141537409 isoform X2 n=1 Tax=Cotesia typhae TaxID=2053667 RepID=UPI003D68C236
MSEYQNLTQDIIIPKEWPLKIARNAIANIVEQVINTHRSGVKISLTVAGVLALVTDNENGSGYTFKKIKEIHEDIKRVDLILPVKTEIIMPESNLLGPTGSEKLEAIMLDVKGDHPISRMLVSNSDRHVVLTAVPVIKLLLEKKGVRADEMYDYTVRSIYIINTNLYKDLSLQKMSISSQSAHPAISVKRFTKYKWIIEYYDYLSQYYLPSIFIKSAQTDQNHSWV